MTQKDIQGTLLIVLGVILIIVFSSINSGLSTSLSVRRPRASLSSFARSYTLPSPLQLDRLYRLWGRGGFLFYFLVQLIGLFVAWAVVLSLTRILENRQSEEDEMEPSHVRLFRSCRFSLVVSLISLLPQHISHHPTAISPPSCTPFTRTTPA